jgi:uridine monophosphate synthetase
MGINKEKLVNKLIELGCFKTGNFKLKSGINTDFYLDFRHLISHPDILIQICELIYEKFAEIPGLICGLPYAGIPYSQTISILYKRKCIMLRKEQKKYGTSKMIEGNYNKNDELIIIDDIITKGTSIKESLSHFKDFNIKKIIVLVDREEGGKESIEKHGIKVESVFTVYDFKKCINS